MDRRAFLRTVGLSGGVALAGCTSGGGTGPPDGAPTAALSNGGFESGLDAWTVGRDVPTDPDTGDPIETDASVTGERAADGQRALALTIDGRQDDGTLWVAQSAALDAVDALAFDAYSPMASANTRIKAAAYTGPDGDLRERDFDTSRAADGHEGWETFEYEVSHDGDGVVAVGVSVVWETRITGIVDNVRLRSSGE